MNRLALLLVTGLMLGGCQEMLLKRQPADDTPGGSARVEKADEGETTTLVSTSQSLNAARTGSGAPAGTPPDTSQATTDTTPGKSTLPVDTIETHPLLVKRRDHIGIVDAWKIQGRVSILTQEDGWIGTLNWNQSVGNRYDIRINGPIGGAVILTGEPGTVTMTSAQNKKVKARTPEALLLKNLGWHMPVSGLRYWVLGLPTPTPVKLVKFDKDGRPILMEQEGWEIQFLRYKNVNGKQLPNKIFMKNKSFTVKLLIKYWNLEAA